MSRNEFNLPIIGGVVAAIGTGLCCVGPFMLLTLGIGGAWIGNLALLAPYRPFLIAATLALLGWAGWQAHRSIESCDTGAACSASQTRTRRQIVFWLTAMMALAFVTSNYWISLII